MLGKVSNSGAYAQSELGHLLFYGSNIRSHKCPPYVVALLRDISRELDRIMWNNHQKEYDNPFENSGNVLGFSNDVFEVHAFDWNEDNEQLYNFKYKEIEISWYKYLGRDTTINCYITEIEAVKMYDECIKSLKKLERGEYYV